MSKGIMDRWRKSFSASPVLWLLVAFLIYSVFAHDRTSARFADVCDRVMALSEGYWDRETDSTIAVTGLDVGAMLRDGKREAEKHEHLMKLDTREGRMYRWWRSEAREIVRICERAPEPD